MKKMDLGELERASKELLEFFVKNCNIHQSIIVDAQGVRVVSDEMFIAKQQPAEIDRLLDVVNH